MHGQPAEGQPRDVDFLDRATGVVQQIERRVRHQIETGRMQLFENRPQCQVLARRQRLQIGQRKGRHGHTVRAPDDLANPRNGDRLRRWHAHRAHFAG